MARTSFSGPVASDNGFEGDITGDLTGDVTAATASTGTLTITGTSFIFANVPTEDPNVAGAIWSNSGVLTVSAGE